MLIVHGIAEHGDRYEELIGYLRDHGVAATSFDLPGHGGRRGERPEHGKWFDLFIADVKGRLDAMKAEGDAPLFLFGHSMGGTIVLRLMQRRLGGGLAGVIVSSPFLGPGTGFQRVALPKGARVAETLPNLPFFSRIAPGKLTSDPHERAAYRRDRRIANFLPLSLYADLYRHGVAASVFRWELRVPLLVMQGDTDSVCAVHNTRIWEKRLRGGHEYQEWPGDRHELPHERDRVEYFSHLLGWMRRVSAAVKPAASQSDS